MNSRKCTWCETPGGMRIIFSGFCTTLYSYTPKLSRSPLSVLSSKKVFWLCIESGCWSVSWSLSWRNVETVVASESLTISHTALHSLVLGLDLPQTIIFMVSHISRCFCVEPSFLWSLGAVYISALIPHSYTNTSAVLSRTLLDHCSYISPWGLIGLVVLCWWRTLQWPSLRSS